MTPCSPPGSSAHGVSQARILKWVAISSSRDLPDPGIEPGSPALAGRNLGTDIVISLRLLEYSYLFLMYPMKRH